MLLLSVLSHESQLSIKNKMSGFEYWFPYTPAAPAELSANHLNLLSENKEMRKGIILPIDKEVRED